MATALVEVERKYDVGEGVEVPALEGLPGVARVETERYELDATYVDTPDLALRAAKTTLRRRTGGADAGWHLKLPLGADREELHVPSATPGEDVPEELHALVRARTRRSPLGPVARLATTRRVSRLVGADGRVLAEVADDLVRGRTLPEGPPELVWREWEVELVDGPRSLLDDVQEVLLRAGASPSGSASKVGRVLASRPAGSGGPDWWAAVPVSSRRASAGAVVLTHLSEQVAELVARDPQVRRDQPDALHKMRVATRRLRSALQTFRPLLDRERTDPLREELRWLAAELGAVRDTEVMHDRLRDLVSAEDPALVVGPVLARVDAVLQERYRRAHDEVLAVLDGDRYLQLLDDLDALLADPPLRGRADRRARDVLPRLVRRSWHRLDEAMGAATAQAPGQEQDLLLHEARKDAKRARYAAEAVLAVYGAPARRYAKAMTALQEVLGHHQDGVVTREVLRELAEAATAAGESAFTYGRLHALEQARAVADAARWPQVHARASKRGLRAWLR